MTPKAERTRQHILETALQLFASRGYAETTLRDIAQEAGVATGLAYRYFARKEDLALALYEELSRQVAERTEGLPAGSLGQRWASVELLRLDAMAPHRRTLLALVQAALDPEGELGVFSEATASVRARWRGVHEAVVRGAEPQAPVDPALLASTLYGLDLLVVLLWTQDRSPDAATTRAAVAAVAQGLDASTPLLHLPGASAALAHMAQLFQRFTPKEAA